MSIPKKMGLLDALLIQVNGMIGAGIVGIPSILAQATGSVGLLSFLVCILLVLCMTYSLGELSLVYGGKAWCYRFPSFWAPHYVGVISSLFYVIGLHIALGFVCQQGGLWLHELLPILSAKILSLLTIVILTLLIYLGKEASSILQYFISIVIVLSVLLTSTICFTQFDKQVFFEDWDLNFNQILLVTPIVLYSFMGFETITSMYALIKNPRKNVLKGGIIGVIFVGILYLLFSTSILGSISSNSFHKWKHFSLTKIIQLSFPRYRGITQFIYLGGLFAILGTLHSMLWSVNNLIMSINEAVKEKRGTSFFDAHRINHNWILLFSAVAVATSSLIFTNEIILYTTVVLIGGSYGLSILPLVKVKKNRGLILSTYVVSLIGTSLMIFFSLRILIRFGMGCL